MAKKKPALISVEGWELPEGTIDITPEDSSVPVYLLPEDPVDAAERAVLAEQHQQIYLREAKKEEHKALALEKLQKLGLTEDEAWTVIGF